MLAKLLLAIFLFTHGWGADPASGTIVGKAWSPPECYTCWHVGEWDCLPLEKSVCFDYQFSLYTTPYGFEVDCETWMAYELGDEYPHETEATKIRHTIREWFERGLWPSDNFHDHASRHSSLANRLRAETRPIR